MIQPHALASAPCLRALCVGQATPQRARLRRALLCGLTLSLFGCPQSTPDSDDFADAGAVGTASDSGHLGDGGAMDTGAADTGAADAGGKDTAGKDTASKDTASKDTASKDTANKDAGSKDTANIDTANIDTGATDSGTADSGGPACTKDKDCDDGDPCTASQCTGGACDTLPLPQWTSCGVGLQCVDKLSCVATVQGGTHEITVGKDVSCAITADDKAWCWGRNEYGQVALGNTAGGPKGVVWPTLTVLGKVQDIALSWAYGCAVNDQSVLTCWGSNSHGQLAAGPGAPKVLTKPTPAKTTEKFAKVTLGLNHGCAIRSDGAVFCWGVGGAGQLGDGLGTGTNVPVKTSGVSAVEELALGEAFTCSRDLNGDVLCWGANHLGQLGDGKGGTSNSSNKPVPIKGITKYVKQVDAGRAHACVLVAGEVWCWGANGSGQLGLGSVGLHKSAPGKVYGLTFTPDSIALGGNTSCAYEFGGKVACWGSNAYGHIKAPASNTPVKLPELVPGLVGIADLALGEKHACARVAGKKVACWGDNYSGQLGVGPGVAKSSTPKIAGHPAP